MFNTGKFAQKTVVISGASRGIGKQIALKLAKDGANIVICAKTTTAHPKLPGTIYSAAEEIIKAGGKALPCVVDVRDEKSVQDAVEAAVKEFGGIDILVNNASAISLTGTLDTPMKRYDLMHGVNTRGTFLMSQKCIPYLRQAKNPHILNLSPPLLMEQQWFEHHVAYTMAKYGMSMCVLGMSAELKQHGIAVNAIWPRTAIWTAAMDMITAGTGEAGCRKADIMADAAYAMLSKNSREYTGNFEIDDVVLTREGVTDFDQYACVKGVPLLPDFFVPGISYQAALGGHSVSEEKGGGAREKSRDSLKAVDLKALSDDIAKSISSETAQKIEAGHEFALREPPTDGDKKNKPSENLDDLKIDFDELSRKLDDSLQQSKSGEETEVDKEFMNFRRLNEANTFQRSSIFTWKTALISLALGGVTLTILLYMRKIRHDERERNRKRMIGKANIGGEWELLDMDGKPATSRDLLGNWVLIYFGFTNCPDICPEEIEKMIDVVDTLDRDEDALPVIPVFISVDPARDTPERVKKYCSEFSPKLRGFTGSKEQVEKVTKAYRVYHSEGPKTEQQDDYIVDHTVIMYLVDPNGEFHDYYSQNRRSGEVANVIRNKALKYEMDKRKNNSFF